MYELPPNIPSRQIMLSQAARRQVDTWKQLQMAEEELPAKRCDLIVSHETAASLMGVTLFRRSRKIHITVGRRKDRIHRKPFVCHVLGNTSLESSQARIFTVPCASPEATFAQLSRTLKLEDLVLLGDSLTCRNPFLKRTSKARLNRYLHECDSFRGLPQCRRALRLIQEDTDSPQETLLRLRMLQYGLPLPHVNFSLDEECGRYLLDMAYPQARIGVEYNGRHHHQQQAEDWDRANALTADGWTIFVAEKENIESTYLCQRLMTSIAQALSDKGGRRVILRDEPLELKVLADGRRWKKNGIPLD